MNSWWSLLKKIRVFSWKIIAVLFAPLPLLFYLPGFNVDFYYIGSFDAVWKYPVRHLKIDTVRNAENLYFQKNAFSCLIKDTSVPLESPDIASADVYKRLHSHIIIRWKNVIYSTDKSKIFFTDIHSDTAAQKKITLHSDSSDAMTSEEIRRFFTNNDSLLQRNRILQKNIGLTLADREQVNRSVFREMKRFQTIQGRIFAYAYGVVLMLLFLVYLRNFHPEVYSDNRKIYFSFFMMTIAMTGMMLFHKWNLMLYAFPFMIFPVMMMVFFNVSLASFFWIIQVFSLLWFFPDKREYLMVMLPAGLFSVFSYQTFPDRRKLSLILLIFVFSSSGCYVLYHLLNQSVEVLKHFSSYLPFLLSGTTLFLIPGLVYLTEKVFGWVSEFRLMELTDLRHPLLRQLSEQVPGTFHHTIQVSGMAEEAAYHLNANMLLVRVGALYHDIGKIYHPEFFIENRSDEELERNDLSPEQCASVIISHVTDGVELAYAHRLPEAIIDFIRTHHGTTRVEYFYRQELTRNENADEKKFRYPGPLPFNKETAILMLADSVEAASRALKNPDEVSIDKMVERIFSHKINDQQLIYSELTFKDIQVMKKLFKKRLIKIYHKRINY